jgi:hypothetical protein
MRVMRFLQSMFLSSFVPRSVGPTRSEGAALQASEAVFRRVRSGLFGALQKAKPAIREGNQNPLGLELLSAAAERGNYLEAKPNRDGAERQTCLQTTPHSPGFSDTTLVLLFS